MSTRKHSKNQQKSPHHEPYTGPAARSKLLVDVKSAISADQRVAWLKRTIAIAFIFSLCLSWKLWISSRLFPLSPVANWLPSISFPVDYIWAIVLLGLLVAIAIVKKARMLTLIFVALAFMLSLWDQTRWQPWFYQYLFILAALGIYGYRTPEPQKQELVLNITRLVIVSTYFWSGLQKLNANFIKETWPDIANSLLHFLPGGARNTPAAFILAVPLVEIAIALGLSTRRLRRSAVILAAVTHIFVLILLIVSGENTVVWPWNIAMTILVFILFWGSGATWQQIIIPRNALHGVVLLLFAIMPALSLFGLWDSYLSSALYSGNTDQAVIYVSPEVIARIPKSVHVHIWQATKPFFLDVNRWSYGELNVPLYPEPRIYKGIAKRICAYAGDVPSDVRLRIKDRPNVLTAVRASEFYDCDHL